MTLKIWFVFAIFYKIVDVASTLYLTLTRGPSIEANPFVHGMLHAYGPVTALVMNALIFSLLMLVLYRHNEKGLLIISTFIQMIIAIVTTSAIFIY